MSDSAPTRPSLMPHMLCLLTGLCLLLGVAHTAMHFTYQWVDGAWNAQVAATFVHTGRYAVTYPSEEVFFVPITTGQTVLLPAALSFRLFGVTDFSAALVPVLYMCAALVALLVLLHRFFRASGMAPMGAAMLCCAAASACYFFFSLYGRYAYQLLGEGAALLFVLLACLFLANYERTRARRWALACGAMLTCALITKTVAVCFLLVFALLMLLECLVTRRYPALLLLWLLAGFAAAFAVLESFKFIQLGGDVLAYLNWWKRTIYYSFGLSSGDGAALSLMERVLANLHDAAALFTNGHIVPLLAMLLLAPACYLVSALTRLTRRDDPFAAPERFALLALGLGGDGFLVASLLFTSGGMFLQRRVLLHGVCFLAFVLPVLLLAIVRVLRRPTLRRVCAAVLSAALCVTLLPQIGRSMVHYVFYEKSEDAQRSADVHAYITQVAALPREALYYGCGWNFAAETSLLLNLPLIDIESNPPDFSDGQTRYLLIESYEIETDLSAAYTLTPVWQLRAGEETYSVCRIEPLS